MNLQEKIDNTEEYGTLVLEFNEYFGQAVISRPITIDGQNSTLCSKGGPVLSVHSEEVELRNIRLEVTSASQKGKEDAFLALVVRENIRVKVENVVVKGDVSGMINEDGSWEYHDVLHIWPVVPKKKNYFVFDMDVPVSCVLETDISDLKIVNPGLSPGMNKISLEVENVKNETILFGSIEIKSTYLTRIMSVSGGSFGIPVNIRVPDKDNPICIDKSFEPVQPAPATPSEPVIRSKKLKLGLAAILFVIVSGLAFFFLFSKSEEVKKPPKKNIPEATSENVRQAEKDTREPAGTIRDIKDSYRIGDTISYTVSANDDKSLRKMAFKVHDTSVRTSWDVSGQSASQNSSFSTKGWKSGTYTYSLLTEDRAGNTKETRGSFVLADIQYGYVNIFTRPSAEIYIDGRSLGSTPKAELKLPAGRIDIRFVNESYNIDVVETITVRPNETNKEIFKWK